MDSKQISELVELVSRSDLESLELESEGFKIKLVRRTRAEAQGPIAVSLSPAPIEMLSPLVAAAAPVAAAPAAPVDDGTVEMAAPIVGIVYLSPSPEAPAFAPVGTRVAKGKVLCIIEAMKVMNEIEAEIDAEIVEIVVKDGQPVEYGEVIFRLRPL